MNQHRPLTEREHLFFILQRFTKLKVELKREIRIAKELLPPCSHLLPCSHLPPCSHVEDLIRRQENLLEKVEKRVWECQMQLELTRARGRC